MLDIVNVRSLDDLEQRVPDSTAVTELRRLSELAEAYGFADWLEFDPSIVRGLAYYTGAPCCKALIKYSQASQLPVIAWLLVCKYHGPM